MLDDRETADDLSAAEYKVRVDGKIVIEPKEDIKERLGVLRKGDALLLTFAFLCRSVCEFRAAEPARQGHHRLRSICLIRWWG